MIYPFDKYEYAATLQLIWSDIFRVHINNLFDKCEYAATAAGNQKRHIETKHEGVRYPCYKCEYAATRAIHLKRYIETKHEGVRYPCYKCEYAAIVEQFI